MARQALVAVVGGLVLGLSLGLGPVAAAELGTLTIADGPVTLLRGGERYAAPAGLRVRADDVLVTDASALVARVELDDGKIADLGPATQVMLAPRAFGPQADRDGTVYLGRGWLKLSAPWQFTTPAALASARVDVQQLRGTLVAQADADETRVYVETGRASVLPLGARLREMHTLTRGAWFRQAAGSGAASQENPGPWLERMPRPFFETLPRLAPRFAGRPAELAAPLGRAPLLAWQQAEPALAPPSPAKPARVALRRPEARGPAS